MGIMNNTLILGMSIVYGLILILGYTVYENNKNRPSHFYFFLLSIFFVLWLVVNSLQLVTTNEVAIFFNYADHAIAPGVAYTLFMFLAHVPYYNTIKSFWKIILLIPALVCSFMVVSNKVIYDVSYHVDHTISQHGPWYDIYSMVLLGYVLSGIIILVFHLIKALPSERKQLCFILISAISVFLVLFIINLLFGSHIDASKQIILNNLSLVWLVVVSIAIKQYLFNIKKFSQTLISSGILMFIGVLFISLYEYTNERTENLLSNNFAIQILYVVVISPFVMFCYQACKKYSEKIFKPKRTLASMINHDLQRISSNPDITLYEVTKIIDNTIYDLLGTYPSWNFLATPNWRTITSHRSTVQPDVDFNELTHTINHPTEPLLRSALTKELVPGGKKSRLVELMNEHDIELIYPISHKSTNDDQEIFGFIILNNETPFLGKNEISYISMILPQIKKQLYELNKQP